MKNAIILLFALLPVLGVAQQTEKPTVESPGSSLQQVILLAALQPESEEFDNAWSAYVSEHHESMNLPATIDTVIDESRDLLRQTRAPGHGSTQRAISNDELREKMQALATAVIENS